MRQRQLGLRQMMASVLILVLLPSILAFGLGLAWRDLAGDPSFVMDSVRRLDVMGKVKSEFLDGLVATFPENERARLRETLDDGVPTDWLSRQLERTLVVLSEYLVSNGERPLTVDIPVVELKSFLLAAFAKHLGQEYYLGAVVGLGEVPDSVDLGRLVEGTSLEAGLERLRPYWRWAYLAPVLLGAAAATLTAAAWLAAGGLSGERIASRAWVAAGLVTLGAGLGAKVLAGRYLAGLLPASLPELEFVPIRDLAVAWIAGFRANLVAAGAVEILAGFLIARVIGPCIRGRQAG